MKSDQFVCRKGRSWSVPNVDELPEIDFFAIAEKTNLQFNDDICVSIKYELAIYIAQVKVFESRPLSQKRKASLKAVVKACSLLESVFELDDYEKIDQEEFDSMQLYLWRIVIPRSKFEFDGKDVADYLVVCKESAREELNWLYRAGRRKKTALRCCLEGLHQDFILAGGEGRGCSREADSTLKGAFLTFSKELLDSTKKITGVSYSKEALNDYIVKKLKL